MTHHFDTADAERFGLPGAVILYHFRFWILKNAANGKHLHDGRFWTYSSAKALAILFPYLSEDSIQRTISKLVKDGILRRGNYNANAYDRTAWFAFEDEAFLQSFRNDTHSIPQDEKNDSAKVRNPKRTSAAPIPDISTDTKQIEREAPAQSQGFAGEEEKSLSLAKSHSETPKWSEVQSHFHTSGSKYLSVVQLNKLAAEFWAYCKLKGFGSWKLNADLWIARQTPADKLTTVLNALKAVTPANAPKPETLPEAPQPPVYPQPYAKHEPAPERSTDAPDGGKFVAPPWMDEPECGNTAQSDADSFSIPFLDDAKQSLADAKAFLISQRNQTTSTP